MLHTLNFLALKFQCTAFSIHSIFLHTPFSGFCFFQHYFFHSLNFLARLFLTLNFPALQFPNTLLHFYWGLHANSSQWDLFLHILARTLPGHLDFARTSKRRCSIKYFLKSSCGSVSLSANTTLKQFPIWDLQKPQPEPGKHVLLALS